MVELVGQIGCCYGLGDVCVGDFGCGVVEVVEGFLVVFEVFFFVLVRFEIVYGVD